MPSDDPAPVAPPPGPAAKKPGFVPGAKRARHQRLTRITKWVTVSGLVIVVGLIAWFVWTLVREPGGDKKVIDVRDTLVQLAAQIESFRSRTQRLPSDILELQSPDSPSPFDAQPWDSWHSPYEYQIVDAAKGKFRLRSLGPDKKPDTPDDLVWPPGEPWK